MLQCNPAFHARIRYYAVSCQHAELINALPVFDSHSDSPVYHLSHAQCMQSELKFMGSSMFAHLHAYMPQNLPNPQLNWHDKPGNEKTNETTNLKTNNGNDY